MTVLNKITLDNNWKMLVLSGNPDTPKDLINREFRAQVPGSVHTDLFRTGVIGDPYYFNVENQIKWVSTTDYKYICEFDINEQTMQHNHIDLVFDGLDTITEIILNGKHIGKTANMFCQYRFDVGSHLKVGLNKLEVVFYSPINYCFEQEEKYGKLIEPGFGKAPCVFMRKMECNFGGDWAPNMPTSGIFKPVYLEIWDKARIEQVRPLMSSVSRRHAVMDINIDLQGEVIDDLELLIEITNPKGEKLHRIVAVNSKTINERIEINSPYLWWPRGYGRQYLYQVGITLRDKRTKAIFDGWRKKTGIRKVNLNTSKDQKGSKFNIEINGKTIFCKGANFIPNDFFIDRITESDYRLRLMQMADVNMNMLRIWGGGFYENDIFYDLCDEYGFLVWQDFMCGGLALPEHGEMVELLKLEARYQVARLCHHPCIVLWCGGNESIINYVERWSGPENKKYDEFFDSPEDMIKNNLKDRPWGGLYYHEIFPGIVKELDPSRPYWHSSGYSGSMDIHPLDENHGDIHIWRVSKKIDYPNYRNYHPRFVSEFGFQSPASYQTLSECMPKSELDFDTAGIHQRERYGRWIKNSVGYVLEHFNKPDKYDQWIYLMQIHQARALDCAAGWFRSLYPDCTGLLYWQLNDCWPVLSWSAIDFHNRKKPLYYATKRFFADRFITIEPSEQTLAVYAHNDSDHPWVDNLDAKRLNFDGSILANENVSFSVLPRTCSRITRFNKTFITPKNASFEMLYVSTTDAQDSLFFDVDKNLDYPAPDFDSQMVKKQGSYELTITAKNLIRDIVLTPERIDPKSQVNDGMLTLIPGQSFKFIIKTNLDLSLKQLISYPVFWCVNML